MRKLSAICIGFINKILQILLLNGYIGISINPDKRRISHRNSLRRLVKGLSNNHKYNSRFVNAFKTDNLYMKILHCGTQEEMLTIEKSYRPSLFIGYNIAIGGSENGIVSQYKHGGSKNYADYLRFKSLLEYCILKDLFVDSLFLKESTGYLEFRKIIPKKTYQNHIKFQYTLVEESLGLVQGNIGRDHGNTLFVMYEGVLRSLSDVKQYSSIPYATIKKRISKYHWTPEQALGFEPAPLNGFKIIILDGVECKYDCKTDYSPDDLIEFYNLYKTGSRLFSSFCLSKNANPRNVTRFFKRYGLATKDRRTKDFRK